MTGNRLVDTILMGLNVLVTIGVLGLFVHNTFIYQAPTYSNEKEFDDLLDSAKEVSMPTPYKLQKQIINLQSRRNRLRFLDVEMHLITFEKADHPLLKENEPAIYDGIIKTCSLMSPDDLNSVSGKILLEERIKNRINDTLNRKVVKEVLFSHYVVQ